MANKFVAVTIRIPPEDHKALRHFSAEAHMSINKIMLLLIRKGVPEKYWHLHFSKPGDEWLEDDE